MHNNPVIKLLKLEWQRIVNMFETSSPSYYPSSLTGALVLFRTTLAQRKITNSPFQDYTHTQERLLPVLFKTPQSSPLSHMVQP